MPSRLRRSARLRVQTVIELNGEKVDIIEWVPDIAVYAAALSPAKVVRAISGRRRGEETEEQFARVVFRASAVAAIGREDKTSVWLPV